MTIYCANKSKAIITFYFADGTKEVVTSNFPPVNVSCLADSSVPDGMKKVFLRGLAYANASECTPVPNHEELYCVVPINTSVSTYGFGNSICGGSQYGITNCSQGNGTEWASASIREEYFHKTCNITVTDKSGTIYSRSIEDNCPTYTVACDDDCPEGYIKIPIVEYPGYKCRPKCPPETCCECDCGDVICCYGNNGEIIKTIEK